MNCYVIANLLLKLTRVISPLEKHLLLSHFDGFLNHFNGYVGHCCKLFDSVSFQVYFRKLFAIECLHERLCYGLFAVAIIKILLNLK